MFPAIIEPSKALDVIPAMIEVFSNNIVGIIIGDIAGIFIAEITN
jgi:hypothetical protein